MASLTDIREGLAANLASIAGVQQSAYMLGNATPPCAEVIPSQTTYDIAMQRGLDRWTLLVRVYVGTATDIGAQMRLDEMLETAGATSVKAAIESDVTLGGAASSVQVKECSGYRMYETPGKAAMLGAEWRVEVLARGDT